MEAQQKFGEEDFGMGGMGYGGASSGGYGGIGGGGSTGFGGSAEARAREMSVEEIMRGYEKGLQGVEEVGQTIQWVQLWLKEERDAWRERLLK